MEPMHEEVKFIKGMGELSISFDDYWTIYEAQDCQSYDDYECAKQAYDGITDIESLIAEFGWTDHPYRTHHPRGNK